MSIESLNKIERGALFINSLYIIPICMIIFPNPIIQVVGTAITLVVLIHHIRNYWPYVETSIRAVLSEEHRKQFERDIEIVKNFFYKVAEYLGQKFLGVQKIIVDHGLYLWHQIKEVGDRIYENNIKSIMENKHNRLKNTV